MRSIIHQIKKIILFYLMIYFILRKNGLGRKWCVNIVFFCLLFLIVHISINVAFDGLKFWIHVANINVEVNVSQIFYLGLSFCFMSKNG